LVLRILPKAIDYPSIILYRMWPIANSGDKDERNWASRNVDKSLGFFYRTLINHRNSIYFWLGSF